jgi:hypothetical protein
MSFELELDARVETWEEAERAATAAASPGHLPVLSGRRKRWWRDLEPTIQFDWERGQEVLDDQAHWGEDEFTLSLEGRAGLAETVLALDGVLRPGWTLRAYWGGDEIRSDRAVTAGELAALVRKSKLDRYTVYRVA